MIGTGAAILGAAGAGLLGAGVSAHAAGSAAGKQAEAANYAADLQKQMFPSHDTQVVSTIDFELTVPLVYSDQRYHLQEMDTT